MDAQAAVDILLVEDNPHDAELTVRALRKHGVESPLLVLNDGQDALDFVFGRGACEGRGLAPLPRVILLDLKLPRVDGLQVLGALKSDERTRAIPVVVVTSSREDADIEEAYARGANGYLVKPVEFEAFLEAVGRAGQYWLLVNQTPR